MLFLDYCFHINVAHEIGMDCFSFYFSFIPNQRKDEKTSWRSLGLCMYICCMCAWYMFICETQRHINCEEFVCTKKHIHCWCWYILFHRIGVFKMITSVTTFCTNFYFNVLKKMNKKNSNDPLFPVAHSKYCIALPSYSTRYYFVVVCYFMGAYCL